MPSPPQPFPRPCSRPPVFVRQCPARVRAAVQAFLDSPLLRRVLIILTHLPDEAGRAGDEDGPPREELGHRRPRAARRRHSLSLCLSPFSSPSTPVPTAHAGKSRSDSHAETTEMLLARSRTQLQQRAWAFPHGRLSESSKQKRESVQERAKGARACDAQARPPHVALRGPVTMPSRRRHVILSRGTRTPKKVAGLGQFARGARVRWTLRQKRTFQQRERQGAGRAGRRGA